MNLHTLHADAGSSAGVALPRSALGRGLVHGHATKLASRSRRTIPSAAPTIVERVSAPQQELEGPAWTLEEYQKMFRNYEKEEDYEVLDIEGSIPLDLEGTFYRNGPGILELGGVKMHCFDGHGLIGKLAFKDGKAHFKSRYVQTKVYKEEMAAQKVLYRGFGSQKPGGVMANFMDFRDKPVANTSMLEWGGKLYALWEAHNPFVLDPNTLETLGEETFEGALRDEQPFTAHPSYDRHTDRLIAFSNGIRHGEGKLHIWELDRQNNIQKSITHKVGLLPVLYLHDFQVTKNWYIFHQAPLALVPGNLVRYFAGICDQTQQITFDGSNPGKFWLVPRAGGDPQIVDTVPGMIWHYGNAHEDETGKVVVDACTMDSFSFGEFDMRNPTTVPTAEVARFVIDPVTSSCSKSTLLAESCDFPRTNPKAKGDSSYKYMYTAASTDSASNFPFRRVVKLNVQTKETDAWTAPPGCFVGEPIFVPRKTSSGNEGKAVAEDDGYIACLVTDGRRDFSSVQIFEARDVAAGPICKVNLRKMLPMAFHCAWSETAFV